MIILAITIAFAATGLFFCFYTVRKLNSTERVVQYVSDRLTYEGRNSDARASTERYLSLVESMTSDKTLLFLVARLRAANRDAK